LVGELRGNNGQLQTRINLLTTGHAEEKNKLDSEVLQLQEKIKYHEQRYDQLLRMQGVNNPPTLAEAQQEGDNWKARYDEKTEELKARTVELEKLLKQKSKNLNDSVILEAKLDKQKELVRHLQAKCRGFGMTSADIHRLETMPPLLEDFIVEGA
jgi:predicted  nucleic acid-binding Zn-ribbon protein